jgi:DNA-binding NarL/FixJ family response regulator
VDLGTLRRAIVAVVEGRLPDEAPTVICLEPVSAQLRSLTERELDILHLVSIGLANHGIAEKLGISANTVRTHVQNILAKLGVPNRLAASALARQAGVLDDFDPRALQLLS